MRAKAVLLRDLEEIRSKHVALEQPEPILDTVKAEATNSAVNGQGSDANAKADGNASEVLPEIVVKEAENSSPEKATPKEPQAAAIPGPSTSNTPPVEEAKAAPGPASPAASANETGPNAKPVGLELDTKGAAAAAGSGSAPGTAELQISAVDSLFDIPDNDNMDLTLQDAPSDSQTQTQNAAPASHAEFDLSNFGAQDFNVGDANASATNTNPSQANDANALGQNKQNDVFAMPNNASGGGGGGGDNMDLDLDVGMAGAGDSVFDDIFFDNDDAVMGEGGDMQHGDFDDAFFGIQNE